MLLIPVDLSVKTIYAYLGTFIVFNVLHKNSATFLMRFGKLTCFDVIEHMVHLL